MGRTVKIAVDTNKPTTVYVKFDDDRAGSMAIDRCTDPYAKQNRDVPIVPMLAKIKVRKGKASSPEIQRIQFPLALAWACTVHKIAPVYCAGSCHMSRYQQDRTRCDRCSRSHPRMWHRASRDRTCTLNQLCCTRHERMAASMCDRSCSCRPL